MNSEKTEIHNGQCCVFGCGGGAPGQRKYFDISAVINRNLNAYKIQCLGKCHSYFSPPVLTDRFQ